jgi:hypothetical protein
MPGVILFVESGRDIHDEPVDQTRRLAITGLALQQTIDYGTGQAQVDEERRSELYNRCRKYR